MIHNKRLKICAYMTALTIFASAALANPSNKWRLQFSGDARSTGTIVMKFSPIGSNPITVNIPITDNTGENNVAREVVKTLKASLPADVFHVDRNDGEDVVIKAKHGAADFDLEIVSSNVDHVRINPDRE